MLDAGVPSSEAILAEILAELKRNNALISQGIDLLQDILLILKVNADV